MTGEAVPTDVLDEALAALESTAPEFRGRLANHAPMVAEAMAHAGRDDAVMPFIRATLPGLDPAPPPGTPIPYDERLAARGHPDRYADWYATAATDTVLGSWTTGLEAWIPVLIDGLFTQLGHGAIRTAHAVRSLQRGESERKLDELHRALGYWAAGYEEVLGVADLDGPLDLEGSLAGLAALPVPIIRSFPDRRRAMEREPGFAAGLRALGLTGTPHAMVDRLSAAAARMLVLNRAGNVIYLVHGVTLAGATRLLLPYLVPADQTRAVVALWESIAATVFISGGRPDLSADPFEAGESAPWIELIDAAIATGDEHAVKFAVAAFDAEHRAADPIYAVATAEVTRRLG